MNLDDIEEMAERDREDTYLADYDIAFEARMEERPCESTPPAPGAGDGRKPTSR